MKKIVCISDTHSSEYMLDLEPCDILIHCGDFGITNERELEYANRWFAKQKCKNVIFVAGNHDTYLEKLSISEIKKKLPSVIYLQDEYVEVDGLSFYGSPYTPNFMNWAFMYERRSPELTIKWNNIPKYLNFLITHGPAYKILDKNIHGHSCGCEILARKVYYKDF